LPVFSSTAKRLLQSFSNPHSGGYQAFFSVFTGVAPVIFFALAGRLLPKEPLKIFPFFVRLSPLPMIVCFFSGCKHPKKRAKKSPAGRELFN
jgi:hypothetical protein